MFRKKNLKNIVIQCYNGLKVLILLNNILLQWCYNGVTQCYRVFPTRAREKLFYKSNFSCI